jgi:uncharacterized membrane protein YccC
VKTSVAAILAWLISSALLGAEFPIFAAIAAVLVVLPSVNQSFSRGIERSIGVLLGVLLAYFVGGFFGVSTWIVLLVIVLALLLAWVLRLTPSSANQVPISAMLVLAIGSTTPNYAFDRVLETLIGAAVALIVNAAIVPPVLLVPAHVAVGKLLRECAIALDNLANSLTEPQDTKSLGEMLAHARSLRAIRDSAIRAVATAEESLAMNPRRGKNTRVLEHDAVLLERLTVLVRRVLGMGRAIRDHYDAGLRDEPTVQDIAREMRRAAHDLRLIGQQNEGTVVDLVEHPEPALTAPLSIPRPHPTHWVLIGSLFEDMRRVREEIIGSLDD